jgi:ABC-type Fe3+-siderophore transport system permease subunit
LILLVIVLIGFDQLIVLIVNRFLGNLIEGFDVLLLGFIQEVGYQTVVWVIVSVIVTMGFGLFLSLMANVVKPKKEDSDISTSVVDVPLENEQTPMKDIAPQTIEGIEEEESKQNEEEN